MKNFYYLKIYLLQVKFEVIRLKRMKKRNLLFFYVSGGIKSPFYITNKSYKSNKKKLDIDFINLNSNYKKEDNFSIDDEIKHLLNENAENVEK